MKRMMKIAAASLCLALAITTLSACSSTENTTKPTTEDTNPTEVITTTEEPAEEPEETTEASKATDEPTAAESNGGDIIPLYKPSFENEIRNVDPMSLVHFDQFTDYFDITPLEGESFSGQQLYAYEFGQSFQLKQQAVANDENTYNCRLLVSTELPGTYDYDSVITYWEIDGKPAMTFAIIPLFYNTDKGCIVGYVVTHDSYNLCEFYYYAPSGTVCSQNVDDPSVYGF